MSDFPAAERLTLETGILAGRVCAFLDRVLPESGRPSDGREFLKSTYAAVSGGLGVDAFERDPLKRSTEHVLPLDRLARSLALTPLEIELCLLAGMPEEHEGFAAVFRGLHPRASRGRRQRWPPSYCAGARKVVEACA